jgi:hypothetical protein
MADDFDIDAFNAEHGAAPAGPFVRGKTPTKRIAAPETAPGKTIPAEDFDVDAVAPPQNMGPNARRAAAGKPPEPGAPAFLEPDSVDLRDVERERRMTENNPFAGDPLANMIATGVVGAGAGALAGAGAAALGAGPVVTAGTTGAVAGGTQTAMQGGSAKDIAIGAALGGGLAALPPTLQGAAKRVSERTFQEFAQAANGAGKQKTLAKLEGIGANDTADVIKRYNIPDLKDGAAARAANQAAIAQAGAKMGNALDVISAAPEGSATLGEAMAKLEGLRKELAGNETTRPMADQLFRYMRSFWSVNGGKASAPLTAKALHGKVSDLQAVGFAGNSVELSPAAGKLLARRTAGALDDLLDDRIAAAAKANPAAGEASKTLAAATKDFRILKTLEPITKAQAIAQRFAPSAAQRFTDAMAHPVRSAARVAITPFVRAPAAAAATVDRALARLYAAPVVTPDLVSEALSAGVAPASISAIASLRKARGAAPAAPPMTVPVMAPAAP